MCSFDSRVVRAIFGAMLIVLAACEDEPTGLSPMRELEPHFGVGDVIMVTNLSGGTDIGSLRWALSHATGGEVTRFDPSLAGKTIILEATAETNQSVTIEGPADKGITISGGGTLQRVLAFPGSDNKTAFLRNLMITVATPEVSMVPASIPRARPWSSRTARSREMAMKPRAVLRSSAGTSHSSTPR